MSVALGAWWGGTAQDSLILVLLCSSGIPSSLGISGETGHTVILYGVAIFLGFSAVLQSNLSSCARTFPEAPQRLPYTDGPAGTTPRYQVVNRRAFNLRPILSINWQPFFNFHQQGASHCSLPYFLLMLSEAGWRWTHSSCVRYFRPPLPKI